MELRPTLTAAELDQQVTHLLKAIARRTRGVQPSRGFDREGAEYLVRCATAAAAVDRELGASVMRVAGAGKVLGGNGPSPMVFRYVWKPDQPVHWPKVLLAPRAPDWADDEAQVYAHVDEPWLAPLLAEPWCLGAAPHPEGGTTVRFDARALAELVSVTGLLAPALPAPGPGPLAPTLVKGGAGGTILALLHQGAPEALELVNRWLEDQGYERGLVPVEDDALPRNWYVTTGKGLGADIAVGTYGQLDVEALVDVLRRHPWTDDAYTLQLAYKRPQDPALQLRQVWPVLHDRRAVTDVGTADAHDAAFGPIEAPLLLVRGVGPDEPVPLQAEVQDWLTRRGVPELHAIEDPNLAALGIYDYGEDRQAFELPGTFGYLWCQELAGFLDTLPWSRSCRVFLVLRSTGGRREHRFIWDDRPMRSEWPELELEELRDRLWYHFSGGDRREPVAEELWRLDACCLAYMRRRGYQVLAEPLR